MLKFNRTLRLFPFSFLLFALFLALIGSSCSFNAAVQGKGAAYLQGEWQQDSLAKENQLLNYSRYHFKFDCDSFRITIHSASKVNNGADSCMNRGRWAEYVKGRYELQQDTLHLTGFFCNTDGTLKNEHTCFRIGVYDELFHVKKQADSLLIFTGTSSVIPLNLHLVKRISCVPKPLK